MANPFCACAGVCGGHAIADTFTVRLTAVILMHFHICDGTGSTITDDSSKEVAAAFIAASLRNLIQMTEAHKDLEFLSHLMETAHVVAEGHTDRDRV